MTEPAPLTPPECDLRGMPYMPVDIVRLFDSDLYALSTGDEFKAAFSLWGKAFLQVPAGSLPDDDRILAHLSGAGRGWRKVKTMALRGWVKCSDGRLYHETVAEKCRYAWEMRIAARSRTEKAREARKNKQPIDVIDPPPSVTEPVTETVTDIVTENVTTLVTHNVTGSKGREGKGREEKEEAYPPVAPPPPTRSARGTRLPADWQPDFEDRRFAQQVGLDTDRVAAGFRDYWHAKAGQNGVKLDWPATWRNWCRREAERAPSAAFRAPRVIDHDAGTLLALARADEENERLYGGLPH